MKRIFLIILIFAITNNVFAQRDPKAKKILDEVSAKTKSYAAIKVKFLYMLHNKIQNTVDTSKGIIYIKDNKYKLFFMGNEIFSNGKTVWTHLIKENEINITEPDQDDETVLSPSKVLTIYEKGFKYKYVGEAKGYAIINLFPEKPKTKKYSIIKLAVDKKNKQIRTIKTIGKEEVDYIIEITQFKPNVKIKESMFVFDKNKYKNVEVYDMRDE